MASITLHGAAQQVTGSCYLIQTEHHRILLECGIRQGSDRREDEYDRPFDFDPGSIDGVIISHAHLDHSGMVPLLVKKDSVARYIHLLSLKACCRSCTGMLLPCFAVITNEKIVA